MNIDYKKFNEYSEKTQQRIIEFSLFLLNIIEICNEDKIPLSDFEKETFSFEEATALVKKLNEFFGDRITEFYADSYAVGSVNNRTLETYIYIKCKSDISSILKSFLEKTSGKYTTKELDNNKKIIIKISKLRKEVTKETNGKTLTCSFRRDVNKRFGYLVELAKTDKKIGASKLSKTSYQNISTEIDKINERLVNDLDLIKNVIKNDGNSGYEIDRDFYNIVFVS